MASRKKRNMRKKRNIRKTVKQKGGFGNFFRIFSKKPPILTPEAQLKKDALAVLKDNGITDLNEFLFGSESRNSPFVLDGDHYKPVIFGDYTFTKFKPYFKTYTLKVSTPTNKEGIELLSITD
jgi:hypothetical protein